ncbi:MAG: prolyl-tRNA synthetase associated domain-containing protein [Hyphomicrobiales bacterium]|nr:prolyl-tRNA synthetase associated domain-containing protein [Hyphomicrobiales bacterium]
MAATPDDLMAFLDSLEIATRTVSHPALFTVADSQKLRGEIAGGHTKNLFLKDKKGALFLVVAEEDAAIDMKSLHKLIGSARLSFGKPDLLMEVLCILPGSVTPFAAINDKAGRVSVILDEGLMRHERLNFHPLENTATTSIAANDMIGFLRATGHEPRIIAVAGQSADGDQASAQALQED